MSDINYLLIAVLGVLIIGIIRGYKKGFLRIAVSMVSLVLVILIATRISPFVSDFVINRTTAYEDVRHKIVEMYAEKNNVLDNSVTENQMRTIESYELPELLAMSLITNNTSDMYNILAASLFEEYISGYLAKIVIRAGSFVGMFVIFAIIMFTILATIKILEKIPVLRTLNRLMGVVVSLSMSLVLVWVFFIASMIFFTDSVGAWTFAQIRNSSLLTFIFNNNLLLQFILR